MRTEFGFERTPSCACKGCVLNCQTMPGFLVPSDLTRMIPADADPFKWAEKNLLASSGAVLMDSKTGETIRVRTLVPATKVDGSCINLDANNKCTVHEKAPFGCAFYDCSMDMQSSRSRTLTALMAIAKEFGDGGMYRNLWAHLAYIGRTQVPPEVLRQKMAAAWQVQNA